MTARVYGDCPYCDRPALEAGACPLHTELLDGEPDAIAAELERQAERELAAGDDLPDPAGRRRPKP